jgi:Flp pilus assembly protein TadD
MRRMVWFLAVAAAFACFMPGVARADQQTITIRVDPETVDTLPSDPRGAMDTARDRVAAGDLKGAIHGLEIYVAGHPGEIGPERLLGDLYYRRGDLKRAEATYNHILSYAPKDKETHNRLGSVYATENRVDDAITEFNRSLPGTDSVPDLVQLHLRKGDFKAYERERQTVAADFPSDAEAQLELGQVYEAIHQPQQAILYVQRAIDDRADAVQALNVLGLAYLDEHLYSSAIDQFNTCLKHDGYNYACEDNLGAAYLESQQYSSAADVLNRAHHLEPERGEALVNLGYLADVHGDWRRAVSLYVQAMTVYPYSPDPYINLGIAYNAHGLYELAEAALIKGLAVAPLNGKLHFLLGDTYQHEGKQDLARQQFRDAAGAEDIDPDVQRLAQQRVAALDHVHPPVNP